MSESEAYIPPSGVAEDGWTKDGRATATCYCGEVQLSFPVDGDDLVDTFICHCYDCRKITASMYASNFIVKDGAIKWIRGEDKLSEWGQSKTIATGNKMTNRFCSVCGTLMARVSSGFPGMSILRIGTVDDFRLHETKLKPRIEQFAKDRVAWCAAGDGVTQKEGNYYTG
ncbi:Mss4-like protein [Neohortaea acidophila]|uniref:Mss4-like protein n=1 Tax=Neohortaea acidophila TaxID=245834 RepID=A0A6A6Q1J3_9PEZI|nr:Mss4-like protein [Neohortaea acidophila]KAF2485891.1 Mss4-like protein [Neohortaea acidophila]